MKSQIKFLRLTFYGPWATPCQESTPTPSMLLVFSLLEILRFGLWTDFFELYFWCGKNSCQLQVQNEKRRLELELAEVAEARHHQIMEAKALEQELVSLR
jgi:hypothetical protein